MAGTISMHPLVQGITRSQWAKLCDARRTFENKRALLAYQRDVARAKAKAGVEPQFTETEKLDLDKETL